MLDTRVSVTYFCMIGLFIYLVARIRIAAPKLALLQVFATVISDISDIFLTIGPLMPSFSGMILAVLVKPAATAIGIGMVCNLVFFPQSTSHVVLETIEGALTPMKGFLVGSASNAISHANEHTKWNGIATPAVKNWL